METVTINKLNLRFENENLIIEELPVKVKTPANLVSTFNRRTPNELAAYLLDTINLEENTADITGKVKFKVIDVPEGTINTEKIPCNDCKSTKITKLIRHANGSFIYLCKNHQ